MNGADLPDPFAIVPVTPLEVGGRRELQVFGAPAELLWLPRRKERPGAPIGRRPSFQRCRVDAIVASEAVWRRDGVALTGNKFPFSERHCVLWSEQPVREAPVALLEIGIALEERHEATLLLNTTGAAASIARAHVHLVGERLPFLGALPREPLVAEWLEPQPDVSIVRLVPPFPGIAVGLIGSPSARARAAHRLLLLRLAPAINVVSTDGVTWLFPHGERETPAPHFPFALGGAELWGRWCYPEREPFLRASASDLEAALRVTG